MKRTPGPWSPGRDGESIITFAIEEPDPIVREYYGGLVICERVRRPNVPLLCVAPDVIDAVATLNGIRHLGDFVYDIRDREGKGWDGEQVQAWGRATSTLDTIVAQLRKQGVIDDTP